MTRHIRAEAGRGHTSFRQLRSEKVSRERSRMSEDGPPGGQTPALGDGLKLARTTLRLAAGEIHWDQGRNKGHMPLAAITRVGWGITHVTTTRTVYFVPIAKSATVRYHVQFGDEEHLTDIREQITDSADSRKAFSGFTNRLWRAVGLRLLSELLYGLRGGAVYTFGRDLAVEDRGIEIRKHGQFRADARTHLSWSQITVWSANGNFYLSPKDDKKRYVALPYIDANNAHVLETAIRAGFKEDAPRLSDILHTTLLARIRELKDELNPAFPQLSALKSRVEDLRRQMQNGTAIDQQEYRRLVAEHSSLLERCRGDIQTVERLLEELKRLGGA
jgi:hypothetical protein